MKIRIKFSKFGVMKFIGHLDIMRYFQKAMRRAGIDIAYSAGYSPHQIMSFAAPLGVGITSEGEYLDMEVNTTLTSAESIHALNQAMVEGVEVLSYHKLPDNAKPAMSLVSAADYIITSKCENHGYPENLDVRVETFISQAVIEITKQTKKSEVTLNLKEWVYEMTPVTCEGKPAIFLRVASGSVQNIKPELVMTAFFKFMGQEFNPGQFQEHRIDLYTGVQNELVSLEALGEEIE